jgi:hypothetical protein
LRYMFELEGMENYQENEIKLGKAFKWVLEHNLRQSMSLQELARIFNLFDVKPQLNAASIIVSLPIDVKSLVQDPPKAVKSSQHQTVLAFVDLGNCQFLGMLMDENDSSD